MISTNDLSREVWEWAESAFPDRTDSSMFLKMYGELAELIDSDGDPHELADVFIMLMDYAVRKGIDIDAAVMQKLEINRARTWKIMPNGTMQHEEKDNG